jgi:dienelactone hydrolase
MGRRVIALLALLAMVAGARADDRKAGPIGDGSIMAADRLHWVPIDGTDRLIQMRLCRPDRTGAVPLVVINHGTPVTAEARASVVARACRHTTTRWFLDRGYAVAYPLRRGYGATGGSYAELSGPCDANAYARSARESARDVTAAIAYATALPGVAPRDVIVVGQSAGGWAALGVAAQAPANVAAYVNMAGGRGGRVGNVPNTNCRADQLVLAAGTLGRTARQRTLWIYTANDSFFGPDLAAALHHAYTAAGGRAEFHALPAFGEDGHGLFFASTGPAIWGPLVERFLAPVRR